MGKKIVISFILILAFTLSKAAHIKGGFITYTHVGNNSTSGLPQYRINLYVYMTINFTANQIDNALSLSVFNTNTGAFYRNFTLAPVRQYFLGKSTDEPCITGDQRGNYYYIVEYELNLLELPSLTEGYTISNQRCCRISGVANITNSATIGNTWTVNIPPRISDGTFNNSARFETNDTVVVCANSYFEYSFRATDPDNDRLEYSFCDAFIGGSQSAPAPSPAAAPPYFNVNYVAPYSGSQPLGANVTIDPNTGVIRGIAPPLVNAGEYVITVCITEIRNGVVIASNRKELHVRVGDCQSIKPALDPEYMSCDGFTVNFSNRNPSSLVHSLDWDFGDGNTSSIMTPSNTYSDTGRYLLKLVANRGDLCSDSTTAIVKVYPGFFPGFISNGICITNPVNFTDTSNTVYGVIDSWKWDFGETGVQNDTANIASPNYKYNTTGNKNVSLIVSNSFGCIDTIYHTVGIIDRPPITMGFRDTLICTPDNVQLLASGSGVFTWSPVGNINNTGVGNPIVNPNVTTRYRVQLDESGCISNDSVLVRVVDHVTLSVMNDTTICSGDAINLRISSDGFRYNWTPTGNINNISTKTPVVNPNTTTTYTVSAYIGSCVANGNITVTAVPYPVVDAGDDITICYGETGQLSGSHNGNSFSWSPANNLSNILTLNPVTNTLITRNYILAAFDNRGCPKPSYDTCVVTVLPPIYPFAGNDTVAVINQPIQLQASSAASYVWQPATNLNNTNIANPVAVFTQPTDGFTYKVIMANEAGCLDSAFVTIKVFKSNATIFVPSAFTPNGDGLNDYIFPTSAGIARLHYFTIFNRAGQKVFTTTQPNSSGWDGTVNGKLQDSGVFVWLASGEDYLGFKIEAKGTITLIR